MYTNDATFLDFFGVPYCIRKRVMQVRKVDNLENKRLLLIPVHKPPHWGLAVCSGITTFFIICIENTFIDWVHLTLSHITV